MGNAAGHGAGVSNLTCDGVPGVDQMNIRQMNVPRTPGVGAMSAFRPNVNAGANNYVNPNAGNVSPNIGGNVSGNIGFSKPLNVFNGNDASPAPNRGTDSVPARNFDGNRGAFGGRPLNVIGGNADNSPAANVDTGNARRHAGARQPFAVTGAQGAAPHVDNSRIFGGSSSRTNVDASQGR